MYRHRRDASLPVVGGVVSEGRRGRRGGDVPSSSSWRVVTCGGGCG
jgi:hypothetical protein